MASKFTHAIVSRVPEIYAKQKTVRTKITEFSKRLITDYVKIAWIKL